MFISAQVAIYPLRQAHFTADIEKAGEIFKKHALTAQVGSMSTVISGEDKAVFDALREVFTGLAEKGALVMMTTFSNTCPVG